MNDAGQIKHFESDEHAKREGFNTGLTAHEARVLNGVPVALRVRELALLRFMQGGDRPKLGPTIKARLENAFRYGWDLSNGVRAAQ